ncbi:hypothetical protein HMPREF9406_2261 [Clostridium sp. HGF2]|nr:hypothetical protein HMPREF9406_2261 [Clostridium sp. HGF2]
MADVQESVLPYPSLDFSTPIQISHTAYDVLICFIFLISLPFISYHHHTFSFYI